MGHIKRIAVLATSAAILVAGCNGENKDEELPEARPVLEEAVAKIQDADSFKMEIEVTGYPVSIGTGDLALPPDTPLLFQYTKGAFVAPDRLQANVQFNFGDVGLTAELIAIGQEQYIRSEILTQNRWFNQEVIPGFSPMALMAEDSGIAYALGTITDLKMAGQKDLDGLEVFHLRGKVQASDVNALAFGLIRTQTGQLEIDVYVLAKDRLVERIVLHEPPPEDEADQDQTTWTISIFDYNQPVSISTPSIDENSQP
jgi:hypothetical protein